jgi:hypothetical protein
MVNDIISKLRSIRDGLDKANPQELHVHALTIQMVQHELHAIANMVQARLVQAQIDNVTTPSTEDEKGMKVGE